MPHGVVQLEEMLDSASCVTARVASDGTNEHRNFTYDLAAFWIFGTRRQAEVKFSVLKALYCPAGQSAPDRVSLMPHEGLLYVCKT